MRRLLLRLCPSVTVYSVFLNNTPVVAMGILAARPWGLWLSVAVIVGIVSTGQLICLVEIHDLLRGRSERKAGKPDGQFGLSHTSYRFLSPI